MLKKLIRLTWQAQPRWLRKKELNLLQAMLSRPLDPSRPLRKGDVIVGGFLGTASGVGRGARQMLKFFEREGVPARGANISRFAVLEDFEAGPLWPENSQEGGIAIFHVNPDLFPLATGAAGMSRLRKRRVIGFWAWELEVFPPQWRHALKLVDEVWTWSHFTAAAIRAIAPEKPVHIIPPFLDVAAVPAAPQNDPLPQFAGRPVVLFSYDVRSVHARKNPEAVIAAFRQATASDSSAVLVIKIGNDQAWPEALKRVKRAAAGQPNIHIMAEKLGDEDMQNLIARADIVMSLHRSEGFGLLMAEGMAAAKPVIATAWSGNLDFMPPDCTVLIDYKLVPIIDPQNVYDRYGACWAEPDVDQAAQALRRLLADPDERRRLGDAARAHIANYLSADRIMANLPASFWNAIETGAGSKPRYAI